MSKLIRRTVKKRGAALIVALQLTALTFLSLISFIGGPQSRDGGTPADTQVSAPQAQTQTQADQAQTETDQAQTETAQPITAKDLTAAEKSALRKSAHFAKKLYEPRASQVFSLQRSLVESQAAQRSSQGPDSPNSEPTLTTDREDYPPYSYVYFHGSGFQPDENVDMIVVETDPIQQSFEPWTVVADANGEFDTSWYVFSQDFNGATFLATATGETSQLTASATFTDTAGDGSGTMNVSPATTTPSSTGNSFIFSFRTETTVFTSGSQVTLQVPTVPSGTNWTTPQNTNSANPGFVSVSNVVGGSASIASISAGPPWIITVNFTGAAGGTDGFNLTYGGGTNVTKVTAPSTADAYSFVTKSKISSGGNLTELDADPIIGVSNSSIFQRGSATVNNVGTGTSITINKPTGVVAGDVMIAHFELEATSAFPTSTGWTTYTSTTFLAVGGTRRTALLYRVAGSAPFTPATEPSSYTFTVTGTNTKPIEGAIVAFAGVNNTTPFDTATPPPY